MKQIYYLLLTMRPRQWAKNLLIFLALIFSLNLYWDLSNLAGFFRLLNDTIIAFVLFCLLSGSEYIINDVLGLKNDRQHPAKALRPIAAGKLTVRTAVTVSF